MGGERDSFKHQQSDIIYSCPLTLCPTLLYNSKYDTFVLILPTTVEMEVMAEIISNEY